MNSEFGILYLIPCPISDETAPWDVLPAANRAVMDALDYFIVENTRTARRFLSPLALLGSHARFLCRVAKKPFTSRMRS